MRTMVAVTMLAASVGTAQTARENVSAELPAPAAVASPQFTCTEVASTAISSERTKPPTLQAEARLGREVFYMRLMGDVVNLVTKAEASIGEAAGHPIPVTTSTADLIVAVGSDAPGSIMSFLLQRKSGYAIWTTTRASTWLGANAPSIQSVYFHCK